MNKTIICYFSATGTTKKVAEKMSSIINGDLFEIEPIEAYTEKDLDWMDKTSRSSIEMNDSNSRPAIKNKVNNLNDYDKVIIGFPVWWYIAPKIINTFIEENDLSGKSIYVFVTSGSSSVTSSYNNLKKDYPSLNFVNSKRFTGSESAEEFTNWLD